LKNESQYTRKLAALIKQVKSKFKGDLPQPTDPITQIVLGFLEWNATRSLAAEAHQRLMAVLVDNNDLRVSLPVELIALIGDDYPQINLRINRMREVLQDIYVREHDVTLEPIAGKPKKQVATYIDTLSGMIPYVSSQLMLMNFGFHAIPVDERLHEMLVAEDAVDSESTLPDVAAFLERQIKAGEGVAMHAALRFWEDSKSRTVTPAKSPAKKKTTKSARLSKKK